MNGPGRRRMRQKLRQKVGGLLRGSTGEGRRPVSVEAICWALNLAPVPADRGGQPSSACKVRARRLGQPCRAGRHRRVPVGGSLVRYTGLAERTARTCLDRLAAAGIIAPCDPDIVAARIKRADRRPRAGI